MTNIVPRIGLGTSRNDDPVECATSVQTALEAGYHHIDTAQDYGNEAYVGDGIAAADVDRDDVFLATKVYQDDLAYNDVIASTESSLDRLGLDYIDLLYVHWPLGAYDARETLPAFDDLRADSVIDHVGLSNFTVDLLEEARDVLEAPIAALQVEIHPMLPPREDLTAFCEEHGVDQVAYSPSCRGDAFDLPEVRAVARKHDVSPARAILAWLLDKGLCVIPKAVGADHILDNRAALHLNLDDEDVARIDSVDRRKRRFDRENAPWYQ